MPPSRIAPRQRYALGKQAIAVEGLDVLGATLRHVPKEIEKEFRRELKRIVEPVKRTTQGLINSEVGDSSTGRLEDSIRIRSSTRGKGIGVRVGTRVPYAAVREFGKQRTLNIAGRAPANQKLTPGRFLMRGIERHRSSIKPQLEVLVSRTLRKLGL